MTGKRALRSDDHAVRRGVDGHDIERPFGFISILAPADAKPAPLPNGEINDAVMRAENRAVEMHDLPRLDRAGPEPPHHIAIAAVRHKADILAVGLVGNGQPVFMRQRAGLVLAHPAKRKAQIVELVRRRREQEIGLVLRRVGTAMQLGASVRIDTLDIMAGRKAVGAEVARRFQQIGEFDGLVAANAGDRGLAAKIAVGEILHHLVVKATFVIEHIMRDAEPSGDGARIVDIGTGTARPLGLDGDSVIIKLQSDPHHLVSLLMKQGCRDGTVYATGHRDDDPCVGRRLGKTERIDRGVT